jgi:hypothetical protein
MNTKSTCKKVLRLFVGGLMGLLMLAGVLVFDGSPWAGGVLLAIPVIYLMLKVSALLVKSTWAIFFMLFAIGVLELYAGARTGMPVSWVFAGVMGFALLVTRFVKAALGAYRVAFPKGPLPFPQVDPLPRSFDTAPGADADNSFDVDEGGDRTGRNSPNYRGGINPNFSEDDPLGLYL